MRVSLESCKNGPAVFGLPQAKEGNELSPTKNAKERNGENTYESFNENKIAEIHDGYPADCHAAN
jgi:hypothetical protein